MTFDGLLGVWIAALAAVLAVLITPAVRMLARSVNAVAYPKDDRWHRQPIPMLGGVAIYAGASLSLALFGEIGRAAWPVLAAGTGMFVLGIVDDFQKLKPSTKLLGQIAVASLVVAIWPVPQWTAWPASNVVLATLWILMVTNAFNLLDNMDGLCAGIAAIAALTCWTGLADGPLGA